MEAGHTASYFYIGKNPAFGFHTAMPFGLSLWAQNAWLYEGGGQALIDEFTSHAHWSKFRAEQSMWQQFCDLPFDNMMAGLLRSKA